MTHRSHKAHWTVVALLCVTLAGLAFVPDVAIEDRLGCCSALPERIGGFEGDALAYCHNDQCPDPVHLRSRLKGADRCPSCGGALYGMSLGESRLLPPDTKILRRVYTAAGGLDAFTVTIAISGSERRSIHRPQVCLVGQGHEIENQRVISVPLPGRPPLKLMLLALARRTGGGRVYDSCYAYWFVARGRETPHHLARLFWMAWDSICHNTRKRWAYVSIATTRDPDSDRHVERIRDFVKQLYPRLTPDQ